MPIHDDLGTRMKTYYEGIPQIKLMRRTPVIIRIDGKAFHTFTRGFRKPFDEIMVKTMQETTKYLCENIQGCVFGYTQSDEITLVLIDYQKLTTSAWFDYEVQKMCSIAASMTTMAFNKYFANHVNIFDLRLAYNDYGDDTEENRCLLNTYKKALEKGAMFDARVFNIPKEEVTNCVYWRQLDATRNSIQSVGQANFSHKELQNKTCNMIQDMLHEQKGINWNDYPTYLKRGTAVIKNGIAISNNGTTQEIFLRNPSRGIHEWIIDLDMPQLKGDGRRYLDELVMVGE